MLDDHHGHQSRLAPAAGAQSGDRRFDLYPQATGQLTAAQDAGRDRIALPTETVRRLLRRADGPSPFHAVETIALPTRSIASRNGLRRSQCGRPRRSQGRGDHGWATDDIDSTVIRHQRCRHSTIMDDAVVNRQAEDTYR
jgi:hypothetical protein